MPAGRPPKPTVLRVLEGNRGKRPLRKEPKATGVPECPTWLSREAKVEWRRVVPALMTMGLVGGIDQAALAAYCQSWARWRGLEEALDGDPTDRNLHLMASKAKGDLRSFLIEFGLTPVSRSRMASPAGSADDSLEGLLK